MDFDFHHQDVPPQKWLDELHSFNIPMVWDVQLTSTQRGNLVDRALAELNRWRSGLQDQIKEIRGRYDANSRVEMERALAPYKLLDSLGRDLNNQLTDLKTRIRAGRAIPMGFEFGENIFGDWDSKRWHLGNQGDEFRWRDFIAVETRYESLQEEYKKQARSYENAKERVNETKADLKQLHTQYELRKGFSQITLQVTIVILMVVLCLIMGIAAIFAQFPNGLIFANEVIAGIMFTVALVGAMIAFVLARRRRFAIIQLESDIREMRTMVKNLTHQAKAERRNLLPTRQTMKEIKADYDDLKATF